MWRQSSVWKWVAGGLHMISVCVLAALIIAFIVLNSGGQNYWKQIIEDSNGGKGYQDSRFLSDTVSDALPSFFSDVELGEELYHIFYTEELLRFWGEDGNEIAWTAETIMNWDGEYASMQQMLQEAGVKIISQENGGEDYVYVTGLHTIRNYVNTNYMETSTSGYTITAGKLADGGIGYLYDSEALPEFWAGVLQPRLRSFRISEYCHGDGYPGCRIYQPDILQYHDLFVRTGHDGQGADPGGARNGSRMWSHSMARIWILSMSMEKECRS